jgi:hypothetical protein
MRVFHGFPQENASQNDTISGTAVLSGGSNALGSRRYVDGATKPFEG